MKVQRNLMKKIFLFSFLIINGCLLAQDGAPASPYYDGFDFSQTGINLKDALSSLVISTHTNILSYQDAEDAIKQADRDPDNLSSQNLLLIYGFSPNTCPLNSEDFWEHRRRNRFDDGTNSCEWNREHTYPRSRGVPDLGTEGPGADVHHLRPADVSRNENRGNAKFGPGTGNSGNFSGFWYPGDEWKGDIARMMMYMYLRYSNQCRPTNVGVGNVVSNDSAMIDLFLIWNAEDPVSAIEDRRNNYLENSNNAFFQGNRNPFIDNPYLATLIWGGIPAQNRWPALSTDLDFDFDRGINIYPNPTNDNQINISSAKAIETIDLININGQLVKTYRYYTDENGTYSLRDLPRGFYLARLQSMNNIVIRKIIVN